MKGIKFLLRSVTTSVILLMAQQSQAMFAFPSGWYLEGNVGGSVFSGKSYSGNVSTSSANSGLGWNINGGWKVFPCVGLEGGVSSYADTLIKDWNNNTIAKDRHWAYDVAVKGMIPLSDTGFHIFGKIGAVLLYSSVKITDSAGAAAAGFTGNARTSSTGVYGGAGADYMLTPTLAANVQWQHAQGNSTTGQVDFYSGGLTWTLY